MKKICYLLILVLLLGCFSGCHTAPGATAPIENEDGTLSNWMKEEIVQAYKKQYGVEFPWIDYSARYYGNEKGYIFFLLFTGLYMPNYVNVGKYTFRSVAGAFNLFAYKDGMFYKVEDLYNEGVLDDACIEKIQDAHRRVESPNGYSPVE